MASAFVTGIAAASAIAIATVASTAVIGIVTDGRRARRAEEPLPLPSDGE